MADKIAPCPKCLRPMRRTRWTFDSTGMQIEGWRCKPCNINLTTKDAEDLCAKAASTVTEKTET